MKARDALALNVFQLRTEAGFKSQLDLAEAAGLSRAVIARIETAASYHEEGSVEALAHILKVPETRLFRDPSLKPTPAEAATVLFQHTHGEQAPLPAPERVDYVVKVSDDLRRTLNRLAQILSTANRDQLGIIEDLARAHMKVKPPKELPPTMPVRQKKKPG